MLEAIDYNGMAHRFAVLIPSRGRGDLLRKTFARMPFLENEDVWIGTQHDQKADYAWVDSRCSRVQFNNPEGSVGIAREALRHAALHLDRYAYLVMTDDNARFTEESLYTLVAGTASIERWEERTVFVAGMHGTASHFDRGAIAKTRHTVCGYKGCFNFYKAVGAIFHCINADWMKTYQYPRDCFALEDRHLFLTAITRGDTEFRICMDAPFTKSRYQAGGQGDIPKRMWNCGRSIERLAHDFPTQVGAKGTFPTPWQFIISMARGATADRLVGGAMRKGADITGGSEVPLATKPLRAKTTRRQ